MPNVGLERFLQLPLAFPTQSMDAEERNLKKGIQLFKRQDYHGSIDVFVAVVHAYQDEFNKNRMRLERNAKRKTGRKGDEKVCYNKNYVNALDCLSAAYLKVDNLEKALRYARVMVSLQPLSCKGYLRLSKIHLLLRNDRRAYDILWKGYLKIREAKNDPAKKFVVNETLYRQLKDELQKSKNSLQSGTESVEEGMPGSQQVEAKDNDPLKVLPFELLCNIFAQFPLPFNLRCLCVSSHWNETLTSTARIFESFHLKKNIRKQELTEFFNFLGKIYRHNNGRVFLKFVNIEPHESVEKSILQLFFSKELIIESLKINLNSTNLFGLNPIIKNGKVTFSHTKSLNLRVPLFVNETVSLLDILGRCENLEKLVLIIPKFDSRSKLVQQNAVRFAKLHLLSVSVEKEAANSIFNDTVMNNFLGQNVFPKLRHLTVSRVKLSQKALKKILNPHIETIELDSVPGISIASLLDAMLGNTEPLSTLRELKIVETETTMDSSHRDWRNELLNSKLLSNLSVLMLRNSCITPKMLEDILLASLCQIKSLHLVLNRHIVFQNRLTNPSSTQTPYEYANISNLIAKVPHIEELSIVGCPGFNQLTLSELSKEAMTNHLFDKLFYLNLSMNKVEDNSLIQLFRKPYNLKLDKLVIQYCEVSPGTVKYLLDNKMCRSIDYKMSDRVVL